MPDSQIPERRTISTLVMTCGLILGLVLCFLLAMPFISAIISAFTLAVLFAPLDRRIRKALGSDGTSAAVTVLTVGVTVVAPAVLVIGILLNELDDSAALVQSYMDSDAWQRALESRPRLASIAEKLTERFDIPELVKTFTLWLAGWSGTVMQVSFTGLLSLIVTFYFLFYLLRDRETVRNAVEDMLPLSRTEFARLAQRVVDTIFATVFGMVAVAFLQGMLGALIFGLLGLPAPLLWGAVMGLFAMVPFLGTFVIWGPTALFLAVAGDWMSAAILAAWGTVAIGLVDNLVYPILVSSRLQLHTLLSFMAVVGGLILLGAPGIVLGPVTVTVVLTLLEILKARV